eukprot:TRINITY_DN145_c0_g1_i3.p1 TRINITY_DN145_c0_g1~~TRINITY_DN145_c0_g1_i3.p1  ORF type:complete len:222 (-),score=69.45 TRINITY_DN145_c0_g1_i3:670-1335(-)
MGFLSKVFQLTNFLFMLLGVALLGVGAYGMKWNNVFSLLHAKLFIGLLVLGGVVLIIALLGHLGASKNSRGVLKFYWVLLFLLFTSQVVLAGYAYIQYRDINNLVEQGWKDASNSVRVDVQNELKCCGFNNANDNKGNPCPTGNNPACKGRLADFFNKNMKIMMYTAFAVAVLELFFLAFSACVVATIPKDQIKTIEEEGLIDDDQRSDKKSRKRRSKNRA